jgi:hypothetical protein
VGLMFAGTAALLGAIFCAFVAKLFVSEFEAWSPRIIERLIVRAVSRLPSELQERLNEEWRAFIADTPGQIMKVLRAHGLTNGAKKLCLGTIDYTWTERAFSRLFGAQGFLALLPLIIFLVLFAYFVVRPGAQSPASLFRKKKYREGQSGYRIRLGNDWISRRLRAATFDSAPFMSWAMLRGEIVFTWPQWRRMSAHFAVRLANDALAGVRKMMRGRH